MARKSEVTKVGPILDVPKIIANLKAMAENDDTNWIDSVCHYCDMNDIEVETIADIIRRTPSIKALVLEDAQASNMIKKPLPEED